MADVRSMEGKPTAVEFKSASGAPIVLDVAAARGYILRVDGVVVDLFTMAEGGVWEDLRFPAQGINPVGSTAPPSVGTDLAGFPGTFNFSGTATNIITGVFQMPHAWGEGSEIRPHIHWMKSTSVAGAVGWQFKYRKMPTNAVAGAWSAWVDGISAPFNAPENVADKHYITSFGMIDMTGMGTGDMIAWQLQRRGDLDAYNDIARLLEFDVHYQVYRAGTELEYPGV